MTGKMYLEGKAKELKEDIRRAEHEFDECAAMADRNYDSIVRAALKVKALQDEMKGLQKSIEALNDFE